MILGNDQSPTHSWKKVWNCTRGLVECNHGHCRYVTKNRASVVKRHLSILSSLKGRKTPPIPYMACTFIGSGTAKPYCFSSFNVCWKTQTCHWYHKRKNSAINNNETILDPRRHVFLDSRFMYVLKSPLLCIWIRNNAHEWSIEISN